jgi:1-acyl-sn-glycerol-3-phosphate acyltransferase
MFVGLMWRWRSDRPCPFPSDGAALVIANHSSAADPMQLWMNHHLGSGRRNVRTISFMMAKEYYNVPGIHWICRSMRSIPVSRDGKDTGPLRDALRKLQKGHLVGIFPEGRINIDGSGILDGSLGVGWLALKSRVPVYPVFLDNVPGGSNMIAPFLTRSQVRVTYGEPIDLSEFYDQRPKGVVLEQVTELMMTRLAELGGVERVREREVVESESDESMPATIPVTTVVSRAVGS